MPETDLELLIRAARAAGAIATRYSGREAQRWDKPDGAGPVTEADLAVNALLEQMLPAARPGYGWLSEETEDNPDRLDRDRVFIVDPIDGTRSFAEGSLTWAHSLAVAERGVVTAAVIYLPMRDFLFSAATGTGAFLNDTPIRVSEPQTLADAHILAARPNLLPDHWIGRAAPVFQREYRPSLAYRMALVAQGRFDGMLTLRPSWEWDIAAGDLLLREAGGLCTDRFGTALRFNNNLPRLAGVIAGGTMVHESLSAALDPESTGFPAL
ncbi:inositol monophosphatase family protein [Ruegeria marina]|uniref:Myo-inositol-1(Or 4)-monophosphatase n=1 Tax=Ruegeria marina TaxID=639004 RepID=A0A1G6NY66_9RHOB|nr:3'(2'),5'-bisphosphate nucleotidase CysQ [Ruegeria marina]SDC72739.1 myo-inositol-1(or 4)-monophosphatase [Ruegeria marina]